MRGDRRRCKTIRSTWTLFDTELTERQNGAVGVCQQRNDSWSMATGSCVRRRFSMESHESMREVQREMQMRDCARVFVTALPPETLLARVEGYVCFGGVIPPLKRLLSDLPLAGHKWGDGFSVRLNRPSQFSVVARMDWDGKHTTVTVSMWHHVWFMPMFAVLTTAMLLWVFLRIEPTARVPLLAMAGFCVAMTTFFSFLHRRQGYRVMNMVGDVLERVSADSHAKFWQVQ